MSCIHYKFKSAIEYKTLRFDGLHVSVADLKRQIAEKEKIVSTAFDLQLMNAQTKRVYETADELIPRNSSVVVQRVPAAQHRRLPKVQDRSTDGVVHSAPGFLRGDNVSVSSTLTDRTALATSDLTEDEKIDVVKKLSTASYAPDKYEHRTRSLMSGPPPPTYVCNRCNQSGHWIKNCPLMTQRRTTGIPSQELMETTKDDPQAYMHPSGKYVVPIMHKFAARKVERVPFRDEQSAGATSTPPPPRPPVPPELSCTLCKELLREAVLILCCGTSFCDECIRSRLLDVDTRDCPQCHDGSVGPDSLIPNGNVRKAVQNFQNETGYAFVARQQQQQLLEQQQQPLRPTVVPRVRIGLPVVGAPADPRGLPPVLTNLVSSFAAGAPLPSVASVQRVVLPLTVSSAMPTMTTTAPSDAAPVDAAEVDAQIKDELAPSEQASLEAADATTDATTAAESGLSEGVPSISMSSARPPMATVAPMPAVSQPTAAFAHQFIHPPGIPMLPIPFSTSATAFSAKLLGLPPVPGLTPTGMVPLTSGAQPPPPGLATWSTAPPMPPPALLAAAARAASANHDAWDAFLARKDRKRKRSRRSRSRSSSSASSYSASSRSRSRSGSPRRNGRRRSSSRRRPSQSHRRRTPSPDYNYDSSRRPARRRERRSPVDSYYSRRPQARRPNPTYSSSRGSRYPYQPPSLMSVPPFGAYGQPGGVAYQVTPIAMTVPAVVPPDESAVGVARPPGDAEAPALQQPSPSTSPNYVVVEDVATDEPAAAAATKRRHRDRSPTSRRRRTSTASPKKRHSSPGRRRNADSPTKADERAKGRKKDTTTVIKDEPVKRKKRRERSPEAARAKTAEAAMANAAAVESPSTPVNDERTFDSIPTPVQDEVPYDKMEAEAAIAAAQQQPVHALPEQHVPVTAPELMADTAKAIAPERSHKSRKTAGKEREKREEKRVDGSPRRRRSSVNTEPHQTGRSGESETSKSKPPSSHDRAEALSEKQATVTTSAGDADGVEISQPPSYTVLPNTARSEMARTACVDSNEPSCAEALSSTQRRESRPSLGDTSDAADVKASDATEAKPSKVTKKAKKKKRTREGSPNDDEPKKRHKHKKKHKKHKHRDGAEAKASKKKCPSKGADENQTETVEQPSLAVLDAADDALPCATAGGRLSDAPSAKRAECKSREGKRRRGDSSNGAEKKTARRPSSAEQSVARSKWDSDEAPETRRRDDKPDKLAKGEQRAPIVVTARRHERRVSLEDEAGRTVKRVGAADAPQLSVTVTDSTAPAKRRHSTAAVSDPSKQPIRLLWKKRLG